MMNKNREHIYIFYGYLEPSKDCSKEELQGHQTKFKEIFERLNSNLEGQIVPVHFINDTDFVGAAYSSLTNMGFILDLFSNLAETDLPLFNMQISTELKLNNHKQYCDELIDYTTNNLLKRFKTTQSSEATRYKKTIIDTAHVAYKEKALDTINGIIELLIREFIDVKQTNLNDAT